MLQLYYEGNPLDPLHGSNTKERLEAYIMIQQSLIGDDLKKHSMRTVYERHGKKHCCGKPLDKFVRKGYPICEICGTEY